MFTGTRFSKPEETTLLSLVFSLSPILCVIASKQECLHDRSHMIGCSYYIKLPLSLHIYMYMQFMFTISVHIKYMLLYI